MKEEGTRDRSTAASAPAAAVPLVTSSSGGARLTSTTLITGDGLGISPAIVEPSNNGARAPEDPGSRNKEVALGGKDATKEEGKVAGCTSESDDEGRLWIDSDADSDLPLTPEKRRTAVVSAAGGVQTETKSGTIHLPTRGAVTTAGVWRPTVPQSPARGGGGVVRNLNAAPQGGIRQQGRVGEDAKAAKGLSVAGVSPASKVGAQRGAAGGMNAGSIAGGVPGGHVASGPVGFSSAANSTGVHVPGSVSGNATVSLAAAVATVASSLGNNFAGGATVAGAANGAPAGLVASLCSVTSPIVVGHPVGNNASVNNSVGAGVRASDSTAIAGNRAGVAPVLTGAAAAGVRSGPVTDKHFRMKIRGIQSSPSVATTTVATHRNIAPKQDVSGGALNHTPPLSSPSTTQVNLAGVKLPPVAGSDAKPSRSPVHKKSRTTNSAAAAKDMHGKSRGLDCTARDLQPDSLAVQALDSAKSEDRLQDGCVAEGSKGAGEGRGGKDGGRVADPYEFNAKVEDCVVERPPAKKHKGADRCDTACSPIPPFAAPAPPAAPPLLPTSPGVRDVGIDACHVGVITDPDCLGPCEPGTSVTLEGIVWNETDNGLLVVNVTWRGKTYVGTLMDATKHHWPRSAAESPVSDVDGRTPKSRGKRGRSCAISAAVARADGAGSDRKLRSNRCGGGGGGARGGPAPPPIKPDPTGAKRARLDPANRPDLPVFGELRCKSEQGESPGSDSLVACAEPGCCKKFRNASGLRFHQSKFHRLSSSGSAAGGIGIGGDGGESMDGITVTVVVDGERPEKVEARRGKSGGEKCGTKSVDLDAKDGGGGLKAKVVRVDETIKADPCPRVNPVKQEPSPTGSPRPPIAAKSGFETPPRKSGLQTEEATRGAVRPGGVAEGIGGVGSSVNGSAVTSESTIVSEATSAGASANVPNIITGATKTGDRPTTVASAASSISACTGETISTKFIPGVIRTTADTSASTGASLASGLTSARAATGLGNLNLPLVASPSMLVNEVVEGADPVLQRFNLQRVAALAGASTGGVASKGNLPLAGVRDSEGMDATRGKGLGEDGFISVSLDGTMQGSVGGGTVPLGVGGGGMKPGESGGEQDPRLNVDGAGFQAVQRGGTEFFHRPAGVPINVGQANIGQPMGQMIGGQAGRGPGQSIPSRIGQPIDPTAREGSPFSAVKGISSTQPSAVWDHRLTMNKTGSPLNPQSSMERQLSSPRPGSLKPDATPDKPDSTPDAYVVDSLRGISSSALDIRGSISFESSAAGGVLSEPGKLSVVNTADGGTGVQTPEASFVSPSKKSKRGAAALERSLDADDNPHSPAYSDISDANENAPMLEKEAEGETGGEGESGAGEASGASKERSAPPTAAERPYATETYVYSPLYGQPPYLTPAVGSSQSPGGALLVPAPPQISGGEAMSNLERIREDKKSGAARGEASSPGIPNQRRSNDSRPSSRGDSRAALPPPRSSGGGVEGKSKPESVPASYPNLPGGPPVPPHGAMMAPQMLQGPPPMHYPFSPPGGFPFIEQGFAPPGSPWMLQQQLAAAAAAQQQHQMQQHMLQQQQQQQQQQQEMRRPHDASQPNRASSHSKKPSHPSSAPKGGEKPSLPTPPSLIPDKGGPVRIEKVLRSEQDDRFPSSRDKVSDATRLKENVDVKNRNKTQSPVTGGASGVDHKGLPDRYYFPHPTGGMVGVDQRHDAAAVKPSAVVAPQSRQSVAGPPASARGGPDPSRGGHPHQEQSRDGSAVRDSRGHDSVHHRDSSKKSSGDRTRDGTNRPRDASSDRISGKEERGVGVASSTGPSRSGFSSAGGVVQKDEPPRVLSSPVAVPIPPVLGVPFPGYFGHHHYLAGYAAQPPPGFESAHHHPGMYPPGMLGYAGGPPPGAYLPGPMLAGPGPMILGGVPGGVGPGSDGRAPGGLGGGRISPYFPGGRPPSATAGGGSGGGIAESQMHKIHELKDVAKGDGGGGLLGGRMASSPGGNLGESGAGGRPESRGSAHSGVGGVGGKEGHEHLSPPTQRHLHTHTHMHMLGPPMYPVYSNDPAMLAQQQQAAAAAATALPPSLPRPPYLGK